LLLSPPQPLQLPPQLPASKKQKKKNNGDKQIKKRNGANHFTAINAIKKEDNNKEKAKAKPPAEAIAAIAAATLKAGNIYKNDA